MQLQEKAPFFGDTAAEERQHHRNAGMTKKIKQRLPRVGLAVPPRVSAGVLRRRRSRDAHGGNGSDGGMSMRSKILCGVLAFAGLFALERYTGILAPSEPGGQEAATGGLGGGAHWLQQPQESAEETERKQLKLEVESLERLLDQKRAMLGMSPGKPQQGRLGLRAGDQERYDRTSAKPESLPPGAAPPQPGEENLSLPLQQQRQGPESWGGVGRGNSQSMPQKGVLGEPLYGHNPIRRPLVSDPALIRSRVPLIVGGTDGSGTRGVVALLQRLKVDMVVEDGGTLDVHGAPYMAKGGWPQVVRPVVEWTHGAGYESADAPESLRRSTIAALGNLRSQMDSLAAKLRRRGRGETASYVSWGFKAPVSMLLVPFFEETWGQVKFLHVVRDGRDIAFSGNQTPVDKFYENTFPEGSRERRIEKPPLMAVRMWNVWNSNLYEWAASRVRKSGGDAQQLDYMLLHVEDLIDPAAKFAAIKDVAEFVGSPLSDKELCCIATEGAKDLGSHTKKRSDRGQVTKRFGKWRSNVEGKPELSKLLHKEGEEGLRLLGYEPERSTRAPDGYRCSEQREVDCQPPPNAKPNTRIFQPDHVPRKNNQVPDNVTDTAQCVGLVRHTDFKGLDLNVGNTDDHLGCCQECRAVHGCSYFTFDYPSGTCYLKTGKGSEQAKEGLVSGEVVRV